MKKEVLGIKIDDIDIDQAIEMVKGWLSKSGKHYVVTTNPETIVMAQKESQLKNIINNASLSIPDGVGLRLTTDVVCYTPGMDLMEELIKQSSDYGFTVGFLGGEEGVAEKAAECLRKKYPKLKITFANSGGKVDSNGNVIARSDSDEAIFYRKERLPRPFGVRNDEVVDILFVAFGQPKQEKWIAKNLSNIPVKVAIGVGGGLDYLSGKVPRAPKLLRRLGFEWLFRLILQPWRIKRQLSLIKYLVLLMTS